MSAPPSRALPTERGESILGTVPSGFTISLDPVGYSKPCSFSAAYVAHCFDEYTTVPIALLLAASIRKCAYSKPKFNKFSVFFFLEIYLYEKI